MFPYISKVDDIAELILHLGVGARLAKIDIQEACRIVPVHLQDRLLLGMTWQGQLHVDTALPFGLRSATKIFETVASALEWIFRQEGVMSIRHYLNDFIMVGPPGSRECQRNLDTILATCRELGVPVAYHKTVSPATRLKWLGIVIDSKALELSLPQDKLENLSAMLESVAAKEALLPDKMESLVGHLSRATTVVRPGRRFMRNMTVSWRKPSVDNGQVFASTKTYSGLPSSVE